MRQHTVMDPHAAWAAKAAENARQASEALRAAAFDVEREACVSFWPVTLIEHDFMVDVGTVRLEPSRLVFAGGRETRIIPFSTVVLLGTQPIVTAPGRNACSVNSSAYPQRMLFLADDPMEFHLSAWYSRWLNNPFTEFGTPATVPEITPT